MSTAPLSEAEREAAFKGLLGLDFVAMVEASKRLAFDSSTTSRLMELLDSETRVETRHAILYALSWHDDLGTWRLMVRTLEDTAESPLVRGQAAEGLSYMFHLLAKDSSDFDQGKQALLDALRVPSPELRYCAANALGTTKDASVIPALTELLKDQAPVPGWIGSVADEAARAIEQLAAEHG